MQTKTKLIQKKIRHKEILYPILKECSLVVKDKFWKQFYEDLSSGKSTKGIFISNGTIQSSNKRNGFSYTISNDKAPEIIVKELHYLITTHTNICSSRDINQKRNIIVELEEELQAYDNSEWTSIKRKSIRDILIVNYAIKLNKKYNLDWNSTISAYHTILNAFENKTHTSKDVVFSKGKIQHIYDIEFSEIEKKILNKRKLEKDKFEVQEDNHNTGIILQNLFENYVNVWVKYIKS